MSYEKFPPLQAPESYNLSAGPGAGQEGQCQPRERLARARQATIYSGRPGRPLTQTGRVGRRTMSRTRRLALLAIAIDGPKQLRRSRERPTCHQGDDRSATEH